MFVIAKKIILAYRSMFLLISPALSSIRWFTLTTFMVLAFSSASRLGQFRPSFQDSSFLDKRFPVLHSSLSFEMTLPRVMFVITKLYWPFSCARRLGSFPSSAASVPFLLLSRFL
jgi:hypothetical protein